MRLKASPAQGLLNTSYAMVFAPAAFVASLVGVNVVGRIIRRTGRTSIIIFILTAMITLGALLTGVQGLVRAVKDYRAGRSMGFHSFCQS